MKSVKTAMLLPLGIAANVFIFWNSDTALRGAALEIAPARRPLSAGQPRRGPWT